MNAGVAGCDRNQARFWRFQPTRVRAPLANAIKALRKLFGKSNMASALMARIGLRLLNGPSQPRMGCSTHSSKIGKPESMVRNPARPSNVMCVLGKCVRNARNAGVAMTVSPIHDGRITQSRWQLCSAALTLNPMDFPRRGVRATNDHCRGEVPPQIPTRSHRRLQRWLSRSWFQIQCAPI